MVDNIILYMLYVVRSVVTGTGTGQGRDGTGQSGDMDKNFLMSGTLGQFISCDII